MKVAEPVRKEEGVKVSVCVVTYNQKDYIRECLDSLIAQETSFRYEIIVGDDASIDGTSEIVAEYGERYPGLVIPVLHQRNVGAVSNVVHLYRMARGRYIAHLDGDDFALPGKLQKQADALDMHPTCCICSHDVMVVDRGSRLIRTNFINHKGGVNTLSDLYRRLPFFAHSSKMFLNDSRSFFYDNLSKDSVDIEIHVEQAKKGDIFHIGECLGAYRLMVGLSSSRFKVSPLLPAATRRIYHRALREGVSGMGERELKKLYAKAILNYAYQSALYGRRGDCRSYAIESVRISFHSFLQAFLLIASFVPGALIFAKFRKKLLDFYYRPG